MVLLILATMGGTPTAPDRNRIDGVVVGRTGNTSVPLSGIHVYLLNLNDQKQDSRITDKLGKFSIVAPVELASFRLLLNDDSDDYWRKKPEYSNASHPHDLGELVLYSVRQPLTLQQAKEQRELAWVLQQIDPEQGKILLSRVATDYPQIFAGSCTSIAAPALVGSRIVMASAIPDLLKSRMVANESSAEAAIRTINTAQIAYSATYPDNGYADTLEKLGPSSDGALSPFHAGLIDRQLASGKKFGYAFGLVGEHEQHMSWKLQSAGLKTFPTKAYTVDACPLEPNVTGHYTFYSDQTGEIHRLEIPYESHPEATAPK